MATRYLEYDYISGMSLERRFEKMKVNNLPGYAKNCRYIVVRLVGDDAWFWGAYEDAVKAYQAADEINGMVVVRDEIDISD